MKPTPPRLDSCRTREVLLVVAFTLIGAILRLWYIGRLGLVHFDEGIYAAAGLWIFSPNGILGLDPSVIAYAPPGYPFLVGLSYFVLGAGDLPAILVSIISGALTIPVVAWLARRTFGSGAGVVAAAFMAISGAHVAFSRMALSDVSFLLIFVLALIVGQRFLERPGASRAVLLGLVVAAAQLFKYNGWLAGVIVMLSAALWLVVHPGHWRSGLTAATWGWGLLAVLVAAICYWPWFVFVQSHGGYSALLAHQRGYLGGFPSWPSHLAAQLAQARALSGGAIWLVSAGVAAAGGVMIIGFDHADRRRVSPLIFSLTLFVAALRVTPDLAWWVPVLWLPCALRAWKIVPSKPVNLVYAGWLTLALLTPFYHPYARLWLPLQALECVFLGGAIGVVHSGTEAAARKADDQRTSRYRPPNCFAYITWYLIAFAFTFHAVIYFPPVHPWQNALQGWVARNNALPGVLAPSDSLKTASASIARDLPKTVKTLRAFVRPPVTFYLGQMAAGVVIERQASMSELLKPGDGATWALLDTALIRQDENRSMALARSSFDWALVRAIPTPLTTPVLLDIDPAVASGENPGTQIELRLMRPRRAGDLR